MVHNDVLQHDFVDSFANLTLKTTFLLKWILHNDCSSAKFIFKVNYFVTLYLIRILNCYNRGWPSHFFYDYFLTHRSMMIRLWIPKDFGQLWTMLSCIQRLANPYNLSFEVPKVIKKRLLASIQFLLFMYYFVSFMILVIQMIMNIIFQTLSRQ